MNLNVLLGLQWGDEGKGKIVDVFASRYDVVARFQGGPNAGHSLEFDNVKHVLHNIPSGVFHKNIQNIIGNGVVLDPVIFRQEIEALKEKGININSNLFISRKAHLILPSHRVLDAASEAAKGKSKIGSTLKGIGPTYMDKTGRNGLRVGDIEADDFREKYRFLKNKHKALLAQYDFQYDLEEKEEEWFEAIEALREFGFVDSEHTINDLMQQGKSVLAEGAQGTLLDIDFGSYPYVTSSNTVCAGACIGLGVSPKNVGEVYGVFKAYCTRVGSGPFPTELFNSDGERLQQQGNEYGATTGRPRRCGWLDLPALKYAIMLNGVTRLIMTKADVLNDFDHLKICTAYKMKDGSTINHFPYNQYDIAEPIYKQMQGWEEDISKMKSFDHLPDAFKQYTRFIEEQTGVPVQIISTGPERNSMIEKA
ncbi:MAG TPA: adenylosuccinate synthase [Spirochaetota bacterium]|nr:adenylosuccinate synthase [Spirochaetota bacterium]